MNSLYLNVGEYVPPNTGEDTHAALASLIEAHPNATLYFPDGVYLLSKPLCTPADPRRAVSLQLSNFTVLKAMENWENEDEAVVRLGGIDPFNDITTNGSNYALRGGIVDGSDVACGVSIDSGRETRVEGTSIKNVKIGLHIAPGANARSSDCDILNVNIVGRGTSDAIGVFIEGYDNTLTNMRIASVHIGVKMCSAGNMLRNLHPLYIYEEGNRGKFESSIGFLEMGDNNRYDYCYADNFATAFEIVTQTISIYQNCFAMWYSPEGEKHVGFHFHGMMRSILVNPRISFRSDTIGNEMLVVGQEGGCGVLRDPIFDETRVGSGAYRDYLVGKVLK